ncbi:MAG: KUP/HAK/KT family potassium transporter, partial [Moraxellaceae bacterium]|nr:KUP/HAK/KT family potassium transporter [Pseudobdellovibrionaceae bacterium]
NLLKIVDGGWFPLVLGTIGFIYMSSWKRGRQILFSKLRRKHISIVDFLAKVKLGEIYRSDSIGVFMARGLSSTPLALIHIAEHLKAVPKNLIFLMVEITNKPRVELDRRFEVIKIGENCFQAIIKYGYLEKPNIPVVFDMIKESNPIFDKNKASFFIGHESIFATKIPGMAIWREKLFSFMTKNELPATDYFELPKKRVMEVGAQVSI